MINDKFMPPIINFNDYFKKRSNIIRILLITFIIYHLSFIIYLAQRPLV